MTCEELPWRDLMQLHMNNKVNHVLITLAYARLIGENDPRHKEQLERLIETQLRRDLGMGAMGTGLHVNALLTKITPEWPGDLFVDIGIEISGEENYLLKLCMERIIFHSFILAYFRRDSIMHYFDACGKNPRRFIRELLYLMCMRLDATFAEHLSIIASDMHYAHGHLFTLKEEIWEVEEGGPQAPLEESPAASSNPPAKKQRLDHDMQVDDDDEDGESAGEDGESAGGPVLNGGNGTGGGANEENEGRKRDTPADLMAFLRRPHETFIPPQLVIKGETTVQLRSLVLCIPFILEHWHDFAMDDIIKMYNKLSYLQPEFNPRAPVGLFIYLGFFTPAHLTILYKRIRAHTPRLEEGLPTVFIKDPPN